MSRRRLFLLARALVAAAGIGYIAWSLTSTEPGILPTLRQASAATLVLATLALAPIFPLQTARWLILLRAAGIDPGFRKTFRLFMVGCFFNYCAPGTTGGDFAKCYYAARGSGRVAAAAMSILVDRLVGLAGLLVVGSLAGLLVLDDPLALRITGTVWLLTAGLVVAVAVYSSERLRERLGLDALISRLPGHRFLAGVDRALLDYRGHKGAVGRALALAVVVHACVVTTTVLSGRALGIEQPLGLMVAVIPLVVFVGSIPISYQGLGTMEAVAVPLLASPPGASVNQVIGMLLVYRVILLAYSLAGSIYLVRGDIHLHPQEPGAAPAKGERAGDGEEADEPAGHEVEEEAGHEAQAGATATIEDGQRM